MAVPSNRVNDVSIGAKMLDCYCNHLKNIINIIIKHV